MFVGKFDEDRCEFQSKFGIILDFLSVIPQDVQIGFYYIIFTHVLNKPRPKRIIQYNTMQYNTIKENNIWTKCRLYDIKFKLETFCLANIKNISFSNKFHRIYFVLYKNMFLQTTNPDQDFFHEEYNTFNLSVSLNDSSLTIRLKDFQDWIIYEKKYTEDDIGREIHKKMDLHDVFRVFSQTKPKCDEEHMKEKQHEKLKRYKFGTIVQIDKVPCYKVQKQGRIAVYLSMIDAKTKKNIVFESNLSLNKIKDLTEKQKEDIRQMFDTMELNCQIQRRRKEKDLMEHIIALEQQNARFESESKEVKQELRLTTISILEKIGNLASQLILQKQKQSQQIQQTQKRLKDEVLSTKTQSNTKITEAKVQLEKIIQEQAQNQNLSKIQLKQQIESTKSQLHSKNQEFQVMIKQFMQDFNTKLSETKKQANDKFQVQIKSTSNKLGEIKQEVNSKHQQVTTFLTEIKSQFNNKFTEMKQQLTQRIQVFGQSMTQINLKLQSQVQNLAKAKKQLKGEIQSMKKQLTTNFSQVSTVIAANKQELKIKNNGIQAQVKSTGQLINNKIQQMNQDLKQSLQKIQKEFATKNQQLASSLTSTKSELISKITQTKEQANKKIQTQAQASTQQIQKLNKQHLQTKNSLTSTILTITNSLTSTKQQLKTTAKQLTQKIQSMTKDSNSKNLQLSSTIAANKFQLSSKITESINDFNKKMDVQVQNLTKNKTQLHAKLELSTNQNLERVKILLENMLKPMRKVHSFQTLFQTTNPTYLTIEGLKIQYINKQQNWSHFIFNQKIPHNQTYEFTIKISHTHNRYILIGVVDYYKQKSQRYSSDSGHAMCYYGCNGKKYPEKTQEGEGFKSGDIVKVDICRVTNTVKYVVNGVLRASHKNEMLGDNERIFMPFVELYNTNDAVEWLMD